MQLVYNSNWVERHCYLLERIGGGSPDYLSGGHVFQLILARLNPIDLRLPEVESDSCSIE
jgi:hypothetical protein